MQRFFDELKRKDRINTIAHCTYPSYGINCARFGNAIILSRSAAFSRKLAPAIDTESRLHTTAEPAIVLRIFNLFFLMSTSVN